jgi:hypothetical protein
VGNNSTHRKGHGYPGLGETLKISQ